MAEKKATKAAAEKKVAAPKKEAVKAAAAPKKEAVKKAAAPKAGFGYCREGSHRS